MATKKLTKVEERISTLDENIDVELHEGDVELLIPEGLSRQLKKEIKSATDLGRAEMKHLVDNFYQVQEKRIVLQAQIRSVRQEADGLSTATFGDILEWQLLTQKIQEKGIKDALECMVKNNEVGNWLMTIKGIGPVIAAGLLAYFDVTNVHYATHFMSYAGLNDNNRPWLGKEKATAIVNEVLGKSKNITDEHLQELYERTGWKFSVLDQACSKYDANGKLVSRTNKTGLINQIAKIPYNKDLKTLMFKIGDSFVKVQNRDSLYGRLYAERKALETKLNGEGHYAEQAARKLATTKIGKDTEGYKWYSKGK